MAKFTETGTVCATMMYHVGRLGPVVDSTEATVVIRIDIVI